MSFEQIRDEKPSATDLSLMSFFNSPGIPESVLRSHFANEKDGGNDDDNDGEFIDDVDIYEPTS